MFMIATAATHKLGDLSREYSEVLENRMENLCIVSSEDSENYIGNWVLGFGFIGVKFPKSSTRSLTEDEVKFFNNKKVQVGSQIPVSLKVD